MNYKLQHNRLMDYGAKYAADAKKGCVGYD